MPTQSADPTARQLAEALPSRTLMDLVDDVQRFVSRDLPLDDRYVKVSDVEAVILDGRKELETQLDLLEDKLIAAQMREAGSKAQRIEVEAKLARVMAALEKHGKHEPDCPHYEYDAFTCTCGLEAALRGDG